MDQQWDAGGTAERNLSQQLTRTSNTARMLAQLAAQQSFPSNPRTKTEPRRPKSLQSL